MLNYEIDGSMAIITGCTKDEDIISIPQTIDGHLVCKIADMAFSEMNNIKSVTIPGSVKHIGAYAFSACKKLSRLVIAEGCETIADWAFISCPLKELDLPHSLKEVGKHAFLGTSFKDAVERMVTRKEIIKAVSNKLNSKACILPEEFNNHLNLINHAFISTRAKYTNEQFIGYAKGEIKHNELDIPMIFNDDELMLALYTKDDIEKFELRLDERIINELGKGKEDDPDFLILAIDIYGDDKPVGSFICKTPYTAGIDFEILKLASKKAREFKYYCITIKARFKTAGNGNKNRMFALNQFEELKYKYKSSFDNKVISKETLNKYNKLIDKAKLETLAGFFKEVKGSPLLTYTINMYSGVLHDSDLANKRLKEYAYEKLNLYYNELGDFDSFLKAAFDLDDSLGQFVDELTISIDDLAMRYQLELTDDDGNKLTMRQAKSFKKNFINVKYNYELHAKYLLIAYNEMKKINDAFIVDKYLKKE